MRLRTSNIVSTLGPVVSLTLLVFTTVPGYSQARTRSSGGTTTKTTQTKASTSKKQTASNGSRLTVLPGLSTTNQRPNLQIVQLQQSTNTSQGSPASGPARAQNGPTTPPPNGPQDDPGHEQGTPPPQEGQGDQDQGQGTPPPQEQGNQNQGQGTPPPTEGGQVTPPPAQGGETTPPASGSGERPSRRSRQGGSGGFGGFGGFGGQGGFPNLGAGQTITLDFRGSDISNVLRFFAMATGWQVVPDAGLTGPVTIISPKPLTLDQAFQVLQSTLEVRGFAGQIERRGETTILKIVPLDRAVQSTPLLGGPEGGVNPDQAQGQVITQVIPIENVDAASLARELQPLINRGASMVGSVGTNALVVTDTATNVKRINELVKLLDRAASNNELRMFRLRRADATDVANAINSLFRQVYTRGTGRGIMGQQPMMPGQPGMPPGMQPGMQQPNMPTGQERGAIVAVPDTRTNSVLVVASRENMARVEQLVNELDDENAGAMETKIVKLRYANAVDVANLISSVLTEAAASRSSRATQGGGASFFQRVFGTGGQQQTQSSGDPFAKVVADPRTNSLIITATQERMERIEKMIAELDVEVPVETTTFVIPLKNAQASDLEVILGRAFGTGTTTGQQGSFGGMMFNPFGTTQRTNQRQTIQRRQSQQRSLGRSAPINDPGPSQSALDGIPGTLTPMGFIPDVVMPEEELPGQTRQFGFGQGGMQGFQAAGRQGTGTGTQMYGRGQQGNYVNLLQFRNNVNVAADPSSNSLIITTTPDNIEELRRIIAQLDTVPNQVMIEVIIAEASVNASQKLGFQFDANGTGKLFGLPITQKGNMNFPLGTAGSVAQNMTSPISPGVQYGVQSEKFAALVQALNSDNRVHILSTPRVFTSNNQQAQVSVTTRVPYATSSFTGGLNIGSSVTYDWLDVGITLNVTPRITADGLVTIDVVATASELLGFDTLQSSVDTAGRSTSILAPRTSDRSTDTSVTVRDGEIVALAGLMRDSKNTQVNKVPLLGDIPIIGSLFRSSTTTTEKTELMIFLIPHVINGDVAARAMTENVSRDVRRLVPELERVRPELKPRQDQQTPPPQEGQTPPQGGLQNPPANP